MRALLGLALLAAGLSACGFAPPEPEPEPESVPWVEPLGVLSMDPYSDPDYPYPLGTILATRDGAAVEWVTADYSVGAIDPSANISTFEEPHEVRLRGIREAFRRDPPDRELGDLVLQGLTSSPPGPGALAQSLVEIRPGDWDEGLPRLTSRGQVAEVVIETLDLGNGNNPYGQATGRFRATLCRAADEEAPPDLADCRDIEGTFDTRIYVGRG